MSDSNTQASSKKNYSDGYWLVKPQLGKLTVANLVNFAEAEGVFWYLYCSLLTFVFYC